MKNILLPLFYLLLLAIITITIVWAINEVRYEVTHRNDVAKEYRITTINEETTSINLVKSIIYQIEFNLKIEDPEAQVFITNKPFNAFFFKIDSKYNIIWEPQSKEKREISINIIENNNKIQQKINVFVD